MSEAKPSTSEMMTELKVSAHLMQLDAGVYCVSHSPGSAPPDPATGLPGARLTLPPGPGGQGVTITGFTADGWLGAPDSAALIRVAQGPAQVLMTVYQHPAADHPAPRLQVTRLVEGAPAGAGAPAAKPAGGLDASTAEVAAHVQRQGDVLARIGEWVGEPQSQRWIEGFAISPRRPDVPTEEIEYQAVLGRGWLSPWSEGGQYCGSRGMALPILGLRVRLRGKAAERYGLTVSATFTDGASVGPVGPGEPCETENLSALEAFRIDLVPVEASAAKPVGKRGGPKLVAAEEPPAKAKPSGRARGR